MLTGTNVFIGELEFKEHNTVEDKELGWVPIRPVGLISFVHRVWCAWQVLTGQADIVTWMADANKR